MAKRRPVTLSGAPRKRTMPMTEREVTITALAGIPRIRAGDDLARLLIVALEENGMIPVRHDVLVVTQKVVSKAEGRHLDLALLEPSPQAKALARVTKK